MAELREKIDSLERKLDKREKNNKKLLKEISDLARENEKLASQLDDQDSQIRVIQDHQLQANTSFGYLQADEDSTVRLNIRNLMSRCSAWAKDQAVGSLHNVRKSLLSSLHLPDELLSHQYSSVAPSIVLNAMLVECIQNWIFRKPFIGIVGASGAAGPTAWSTESDFLDIKYQKMLENRTGENYVLRNWPSTNTKPGDWSKAQSWRSLTLQLLESPEQETCIQQRRLYYSWAQSQFSEQYGYLCRRSNTYESDRELYEIMSYAGDLFSPLWKRKIYIEYSGMPFYTGSQELEAHPTEHLIEGDTSKDGYPVRLVVQPAILAYGDEEGNHYDQVRIWAKAVVWLGGSEAG